MTKDTLLGAGEEVIWSGSPKAIRFALSRAWMPFLWGLVFVLIALAYFLGRVPLPPPTNPKSEFVIAVTKQVYSIAGVVGVSCLLSVAWFWLRATRTTYLLTNRRVVIDTKGPLPTRTSIRLEHVRFMELRSNILSPGDLVFEETRRYSPDGWGLRGVGFIAIPEAVHVEQMVREAIEQTFATRTRGQHQ